MSPQGRAGSLDGPDAPQMALSNSFGKLLPKLLVGVVVLFVAILVLDNVLGAFGYVWFDVQATEVGVRFRGNQPYEVVGPGKWSRFGLFESMKSVKVEGLPFRISDPEVLTRDKQRIGIVVAGTVHRPGIEKQPIVLQMWSNYSNFYLDDALLVGREVASGEEGRVVPGLMQSLGQQAAKVCVGDLNFDDAVIGSARDVLRECIDKELDKLAQGYGLEVRNVVVPDVIMSKEVQLQLDEITKARLNTQLAIQKEQQAKAEAKQEQAKQQGQIQVEQGRIQEKATQDAITAELERKAKEAQKALIEAEKSNLLLAATKDKEIAEINRQIALVNAEAELAPEIAKAKAYEANPNYLDLKKTEAMVAAYKQTDKVLLLPPGTNPMLFLGAQDVPVTVTAPQASRP